MPNQIQKIIDGVGNKSEVINDSLWYVNPKDIEDSITALLKEEVKELEAMKEYQNKCKECGHIKPISKESSDIKRGYNSALTDLITKKKQIISELEDNL